MENRVEEIAGRALVHLDPVASELDRVENKVEFARVARNQVCSLVEVACQAIKGAFLATSLLVCEEVLLASSHAESVFIRSLACGAWREAGSILHKPVIAADEAS